MLRIAIAIMCVGLLGACDLHPALYGPKGDEVVRAKRLQVIFPNPADQTGIEMVYPVEESGPIRTLEIWYRRTQVSLDAVLLRANAFCARYGQVATVVGEPDVQLRALPRWHIGTIATMTEVTIRCVPPSLAER